MDDAQQAKSKMLSAIYYVGAAARIACKTAGKTGARSRTASTIRQERLEKSKSFLPPVATAGRRLAGEPGCSREALRLRVIDNNVLGKASVYSLCFFSGVL